MENKGKVSLPRGREVGAPGLHTREEYRYQETLQLRLGLSSFSDVQQQRIMKTCKLMMLISMLLI